MRLSRRRQAAVLGAGCAVATLASLLVGPSAGAAPGCVSPPDFAHSVPGVIGGPAAAPAADGTVYWATLGGDRKTYAVETTITGPGLEVGPLECLGGGAVDTPAVVGYQGGKALYVLAPTGRVYESYAPDGGTQTTWTLLPGAPVGGSAPVLTTSGNGRTLEMFLRGQDNQLYHAQRSAAPDGTWSAFENLGGGLTGLPAAGSPDGGVLVAVVRAPTGTLYQRKGATGGWGPWTKLAGTTSASPAIAAGFAPGRLDLLVTGTTGGLYQSTWTAGATGFGAFKKIDTNLPAKAKLAAAAQGGRMIVYTTAGDGAAVQAGYDRYVPRLGWSGFDLAPYSCADCLPDDAVAAAARRPAPARPLR